MKIRIISAPNNASKWHHALGGYLFPDGGYMIPTAWSSDLQNMLDRNWKNSVAERSPYINEFNRLNNSNLTWGQIRDIIGSNNYTIQDNTVLQLTPKKVDRIDFTEASGLTPTPRLGDFQFTVPNGNPSGNPDGNPSKKGPSGLTYLRYAPILGSAIGLGYTLFNKPDHEYANELEEAAEQYSSGVPRVTPSLLGDYLSYNPFDRLFYANELGAQQAATRSAIMNSSNRNAGQAMAALLASSYNDNIGLGKLYREGEEYNLNQRHKVAEFNRATNQFNSEADLKAQMFNAELDKAKASLLLDAKMKALGMKQADDLAYSQNLSLGLSGLFDNLGDVGRESYIMDMVRNNPSLLYDWLGNYKGRQAKNGGCLTIKNRRRK